MSSFQDGCSSFFRDYDFDAQYYDYEFTYELNTDFIEFENR